MATQDHPQGRRANGPTLGPAELWPVAAATAVLVVLGLVGGGWGAVAAIPLVAGAALATWLSARRRLAATETRFAQAVETIAAQERQLETLADRSWERSESEELYRLLIDAHGDLVVHRDPAGNVVSVNAAFADMLGIDPAAAVGKPLHLDIIEQSETGNGNATGPGDLSSRDLRIRTVRGERWFAWTDIPLRGGDGRLGPVQSVARDITVRKETERVLREARLKAEAANEAKSRMLATVSHEIRTPLNGILGLINLQLETRLTAEQETFARAVRSSGELLLGLIDDMLDFAKIEAGRLDLNEESCRLEELAEETVELLAARAHAKGLDLAAYVAPEVPAVVSTDPARLRQVLINLIGNGIKFTETGGVTLVIQPMPDEGTGETVIGFAVEDTGPGIAPEDRERIFGEFERLPAIGQRTSGGAGLGLAISRRIIRRMGGDIVAERRAMGGSAFSFALPLAVETPAEIPAPKNLAGRRLLLVAPDGPEPDALARLLADRGAEIRHATAPIQASALAAAAAAAGLPYDSCLVDIRIGSDPAELLAQLRLAASRPLPAAVLIDPASRKRVDSLKESGFDAYLVRPVRRSSLTRIAAHLVEPESGFGVDPGDLKPVSRPATRRRRRALEVLVVEDDEINALLARSVLERLGHGVTEVHDGNSAIQAVVGGGRFDVVLLDLNLPEADGFAAAAAIREHERQTGLAATILAVTADSGLEARQRAAEAGCDDVLVKPVDPDALRQALAGLKSAAAA